jgi:hypothetical protein
VLPQSMSDAARPQVEYREIPGFPGYRVGDDGTIWGKRLSGGRTAKEWRRLKGTPDKDGYLKVILYRPDATRRYTRLNILVLEVFVGPCPDGMVCAHENGVRTNNRRSNLSWKTQQANIEDKKRHGTHQAGDTHPTRKLSASQAAEIRRRRAAGERGVDLAREFKVKPATISAIYHERNWKKADQSHGREQQD